MKYLALDLGASSGKLFLGDFDGSKLQLNQIHKFANQPVSIGKGVYWDFIRIFSDMIDGIRKASAGSDFVSMGIDGFCNDFSFIDKSGDLLFPVRCYRDNRTKRHEKVIYTKIPKQKLYILTGIQSAVSNTLMQLVAMQEEGQGYLFDKSDKMLFLPDLLIYYLTGQKNAEFTLGSVSQLMNHNTLQWDKEILQAFVIPERMLGQIVMPGTVIGKSLTSTPGLEGIKPFDVTAVCEHDTASAFAGFSSSDDSAVISSGTWIVCGVPSQSPVINQVGMKNGITNEGNANNKYFLVKNIMGSWITQETIRSFAAQGRFYEYEQIESMIKETKPFGFVFDVDDEVFFSPGNMIEKIQEKCLEFNGSAPESPGEIFRCIQESLAFKCRLAFEDLHSLSRKSFSRIYIIDGGAKDAIACSFISSVCNIDVYAGPTCASAAGNVLVQMLGHNEIASLDEGGELLHRSFHPTVYHPVQPKLWNEKYLQFQEKLKIIRMEMQACDD